MLAISMLCPTRHHVFRQLTPPTRPKRPGAPPTSSSRFGAASSLAATGYSSLGLAFDRFHRRFHARCRGRHADKCALLGTRLAIMLTGAASAVLWPHSSIYSQAVVLFNRAEEPRTLSISWVRDFLALSGPFPTVGPLWAISAHVQTESVFFS